AEDRPRTYVSNGHRPIRVPRCRPRRGRLRLRIERQPADAWVPPRQADRGAGQPAGARGRRTDVMLSPEHLEVAAHSLTAVLSAWLGLTLLSRSRALPARVFGVLCLALVAWSSSVIVQRLSNSLSAVDVAHAVEELSAALIVPATAHFSLVIATEGHPSRRQIRALALAYGFNLLFA